MRDVKPPSSKLRQAVVICAWVLFGMAAYAIVMIAGTIVFLGHVITHPAHP